MVPNLWILVTKQGIKLAHLATRYAPLLLYEILVVLRTCLVELELKLTLNSTFFCIHSTCPSQSLLSSISTSNRSSRHSPASLRRIALVPPHSLPNTLARSSSPHYRRPTLPSSLVPFPLRSAISLPPSTPRHQRRLILPLLFGDQVQAMPLRPRILPILAPSRPDQVLPNLSPRLRMPLVATIPSPVELVLDQTPSNTPGGTRLLLHRQRIIRLRKGTVRTVASRTLRGGKSASSNELILR